MDLKGDVIIIRGDGYWPEGSPAYNDLCSTGKKLAEERFGLSKNVIFFTAHPGLDYSTNYAGRTIQNAFFQASSLKYSYEDFCNELGSHCRPSVEDIERLHKHDQGSPWASEWEFLFPDKPNFREEIIFDACIVWDKVLGTLRYRELAHGRVVIIASGLVIPALINRALGYNCIHEKPIIPPLGAVEINLSVRIDSCKSFGYENHGRICD